MVAEVKEEGRTPIKIKVNGTEMEATQVAFSAVTEPWAEYHLEDGRIARVKLVVTKIYRTETVNEDGTPIYSFHSQQIMAVDEKQE